MTQPRPVRVLIADDHPRIRDVLSLLIDREDGLELVAVAADAAEAVELAERERPDVALVDMLMPAGGGVAAARGIAAGSPVTKVIAVSAAEVPPDVQQNFVDCLDKGGSIGAIVDAVKRASKLTLPNDDPGKSVPDGPSLAPPPHSASPVASIRSST